MGVTMRNCARGQASLEAVLSLAALFACLGVLLHAASCVASDAQRFADGQACALEAEMLAFQVNERALVARDTSFSEVELGECVLLNDSVACCNESARLLAGASGGKRYGIVQTLPI